MTNFSSDCGSLQVGKMDGEDFPSLRSSTLPLRSLNPMICRSVRSKNFRQVRAQSTKIIEYGVGRCQMFFFTYMYITVQVVCTYGLHKARSVQITMQIQHGSSLDYRPNSVTNSAGPRQARGPRAWHDDIEQKKIQ